MRVTPAAAVRLVMFLAAMVFVSVGFRWESQHFLPFIVRAGALAGIFILIAWPGWSGWTGVVANWVSTLERHPRLTIGVLAAASFVATTALAYVVHRPYPHISDGFAYYFQAKVFASGALTAPAPIVPESFRFEWLAVHDGRWFSIFPPGWPVLLAAGIELGVPALVNPLLGALCVVVIYRLGAALFDVKHGILCAILCCLSPFFLFMSSEFMSHTAALLFTSLSTLYHVRAHSARSGTGWFAVSGAAAGAAFLIRPLDALVIWAAQIAHGLWTVRSARLIRGALVSAACLAGGIALYLAYNRVLVGAWFSGPLALVAPNNRLGFGPAIGYPLAFETAGHSPWRALVNLNHNAAVMSQDLFGWPVTSLFFVLVLAAFGTTDRRHWLSGTIILSIVAAYSLFWYHGEAYGARFYFTLLPHILLLTVAGIRQAPAVVARLFAGANAATASRVVVAFVTLCVIFGWTVYVPKISFISPYFNHKGVNDGFDEFRRRERLDRAIVFVHAPEPLYYGPALLANEIPPEHGSVIYVRDLDDAANARVLAAFPGRSVHRYTYAPQPNPLRARLEAWLRTVGILK